MLAGIGIIYFVYTWYSGVRSTRYDVPGTYEAYDDNIWLTGPAGLGDGVLVYTAVVPNYEYGKAVHCEELLRPMRSILLVHYCCGVTLSYYVVIQYKL